SRRTERGPNSGEDGDGFFGPAIRAPVTNRRTRVVGERTNHSDCTKTLPKRECLVGVLEENDPFPRGCARGGEMLRRESKSALASDIAETIRIIEQAHSVFDAEDSADSRID